MFRDWESGNSRRVESRAVRNFKIPILHQTNRTTLMEHVTAMENSYVLVAKLALLTTNECSRKIPYHGVYYLLISDTVKLFIFEKVSSITKEFCLISPCFLQNTPMSVDCSDREAQQDHLQLALVSNTTYLSDSKLQNFNHPRMKFKLHFHRVDVLK
jgi:hypothetical protein